MVNFSSFIDNIKPGVWFVQSNQPVSDIARCVFNLCVTLGDSINIFTEQVKELQSSTMDLIIQNRIASADNESEKEWLEQELSEYGAHGFFWNPEDMNHYAKNGPFWQYNAIIHNELFNVSSFCHQIVIVDGSTLMLQEPELDLLEVDDDAKRFNRSILLFMDQNSMEQYSKGTLSDNIITL